MARRHAARPTRSRPAAVLPRRAEELRQLVVDKWGVSYDVTLQRRGKNMYLHVMWKYLEQQSFPLTEEEYMAQLGAVCRRGGGVPVWLCLP